MSDTAFSESKDFELEKFSGSPVRLEKSNSAIDSFKIVLADHNICMLIPAGATIDVNSMNLQGGLLILGALRGKVFCASGSVVIGPEGEFQGSIEANDIVVEGKITSAMGSNGKPSSMSTVKAVGKKNHQGEVLGGIIALSDNSYVCANMTAIAYSIRRLANLSQSVCKTIVV